MCIQVHKCIFLPHPDGPQNATTSPALIVKLKALRIGVFSRLGYENIISLYSMSPDRLVEGDMPDTERLSTKGTTSIAFAFIDFKARLLA